jgi:hypothetical protein
MNVIDERDRPLPHQGIQYEYLKVKWFIGLMGLSRRVTQEI